MQTNVYPKDTTYNGHKNWTHWNVSLWLYNDEDLYGVVQDAIRQALKRGRGIDRACYIIKDALPSKTPDGASYSICSIREAIREDFAEAEKRAN